MEPETVYCLKKMLDVKSTVITVDQLKRIVPASCTIAKL